MIALLRGINVGGNHKVPMLELRAVAADAGFVEVETYIQSGNLLFDAGRLSAKQAAARLEGAIEKHFGFAVDVIVRTALEWKKYTSGNPFPEAARARPNLLLLGLAKLPCAGNAEAVLGDRTTQGERIKIIDNAIWVDFGTSVGRSKLIPTLFDKAAGSPVTMRNWRSVLKLGEMLEQRE